MRLISNFRHKRQVKDNRIDKMVEIEIVNANNNEDEANVVEKEILARIDMDLVNEARQSLKQEYENQQNSDQNKFSQNHYEEIMDELSPITCWRYIIHCDRSIIDSVTLMKSALIWRKENKIEESLNKIDNELPKEFYHLSPFAFTGLDNLNNEVLYIIGKNYRKPSSQLKSIVIKFVVQSLFKWDYENRNNLNQLCCVFDTTDTGYRNIDLDLMTHLVSMRDFIPARFNRVFVIGIPFIIRPLVRLIISWLPEAFRKIVHCGTYEQLVAPNISVENLPHEVGGCCDDTRRLAPIDSPWLDDSPVFDDALRKAAEASFGFNVPTEFKDKLKALQIEREDKVRNLIRNN